MSEIRKNKSDFSLATGEITREEKVDANNNLSSTLGTKLDAVNDKVTTRAEGMSYVNLTASGLVRTGATTLRGFFVSSTTAGTVKIWDNTAASGTVLIDTITPSNLGWYDCGNLSAGTGVYVTLGGTISVTISYVDNTTV